MAPHRVDEVVDQRAVNVGRGGMPLHAFAIRSNSQCAGVQIVHENRAARPEYVQCIPTFGRGVRHRHYCAWAAIEAQEHGGGVFDRAIEDDIGDRSSGLGDAAAKQVHEHFEPMTTKVHHRSSARDRRLQQPRPRMIRWRIEILEGIQLGEHRRADFTGGDDLFDPVHRWMEAAVVGNAERHAMRPARRDHAIAFGAGHRHRLFAQHVLAGLGGGDGLGGVQVHRGRDVDTLHVVIRNEILPPRVPAPRSNLRRECWRELAACTADGDDLAAGRVEQRRRDPPADDVARANQAPPHRTLPPHHQEPYYRLQL